MNIRNKIWHYVKIGIVLVAAFFISRILNQEIFIPDTPTFRPHLGSYLIARFQQLTGWDKQNRQPANYLDQLAAQHLQHIPLQQVSKGVYAKEDNQVKYTEVHTDEVNWRIYTVTINGKEVKIRVPADKPPLSFKQVESLIDE